VYDARGIMRIRVVYTGFGVGREAFNVAVLSAEWAFVRGLIGQVMDRTPVKIGGCGGRKTRRV
jgi:small subunit ribosomal protein S11